MKRLLISLSVLTVSLFLIPASGLAQSKTAAQPTSEQSLQELVAEVRQLRTTLQRMNAAVYKGQVLLERLKLQQEQVTRISRELAVFRDDLQELRSAQQRMKEMLPRLEEGVTAGTKHQSEVAEMKRELESAALREQQWMARETRLAADLEGERAKLNDLNDKLNALVEIEMTPK